MKLAITIIATLVAIFVLPAMGESAQFWSDQANEYFISGKEIHLDCGISFTKVMNDLIRTDADPAFPWFLIVKGCKITGNGNINQVRMVIQQLTDVISNIPIF